MEETFIPEILRLLDDILVTVQQTREDIKQLKCSDDKFDDDPLITNRQLAEILDVKTKQIIEYRKKKLIEAVIIRNRVFFRRSAVRKFIEDHINKGDHSYGKQCYERTNKCRQPRY